MSPLVVGEMNDMLSTALQIGTGKIDSGSVVAIRDVLQARLKTIESQMGVIRAQSGQVDQETLGKYQAEGNRIGEYNLDANDSFTMAVDFDNGALGDWGVGHDGWTHIVSMIDWLCEHWHDPEEGIWETRGGRQEFTYGHPR